MDLYHDIMRQAEQLLGKPDRCWGYDEAACLEDSGRGELVLQKQTAYELGGSGLPAAFCQCVTTTAGIVNGSSIELYGPDLDEISSDSPYARISLLLLSSISSDDDEAFRTIQDLEFVKYHIFPRGFMMRISSFDRREQVRVSRAALHAGISFRRVGCNFIQGFLEHPEVFGVRQIFVTNPQKVTALLPLAEKSAELTRALNHIFDDLPTSCSSCNLKSLCDEVEGMRELHFKRANRNRV